MAKCSLNFPQPAPPPQPVSVTLDLSMHEARALSLVLGAVGGSETYSARGAVDRIFRALEVAIPYYENTPGASSSKNRLEAVEGSIRMNAKSLELITHPHWYAR